MNIQEAKQEIIHTLQAYLRKGRPSARNAAALTAA